jgi:hypothetical protein
LPDLLLRNRWHDASNGQHSGARVFIGAGLRLQFRDAFVHPDLSQPDHHPGLVKAALVSYLSSLQIGETVTRSALFAIAMSVMPNLLLPAYSITALTLGTASAPTGVNDISMSFGQVASSAIANILINGS